MKSRKPQAKLSVLPSIASNMAAVGMPTVTVRLGDGRSLGNNIRTVNNKLPDRKTPIPDQPQIPPPPTPTKPQRAEEPEPAQEPAPPEPPQQEEVTEADTTAEFNRSDKGKKPAEPLDDDTGTVEEDENEWMRYPLPSALRSTPDDLPETVLEIVRISAENVAARVAEAEARRRQEEEARRRAKDEEAEAEAQKEKEKSKGKEKEIDYFPIIIPDPEAEKKRQEEELARQEEEWARRRQAAWSDKAGFDTGGGINGAGSKERGHKRHKYSVSRILGLIGSDDKGESSKSGIANGTRRKGVTETTAANALGNRDAILKQLGVGTTKIPDRKSNELSRAIPLSDMPPPDIDPRLSQLRVATALLQKNFENPDQRLSTVGSVRRRVKGKAKQVMRDSVIEGSGDDETGPNNDRGDAATAQSEDGQAESQSDGDSTAHEECISCFDDFLPETMVKAPCHSYCRDCFTRLIANALQNEQQWPPKCCLNEIPFSTIYACIETDLRNTFQTRAREWSTPIAERVYCHNPECSVWLSADYINAARRIATCPDNHTTCTICRGAAHEGSDCPEDRDINRTNELAEAEGWKRCARCRALVEHGEACQHMTCRCGYEFCYVCTRVWRTCGCTMEQLAAVKAEATRRRLEREEREAREESELQEALTQIENLELQEALRAIERSLERERKEMLRRRLDIAARLGAEDRRRAAVEEKFFSYREALAALHDRQREALDNDAKKSMADLQRENMAEMSRLQEAHDSELAEVRSRADSRLEELQRELASEGGERMAIQRKAEEEYRASLTTYYSYMKNEEAEIEKAILAYRVEMEARREEWEKWREGEVDGAKFVAAENLELRREGLLVKRERREKELRGRETDERKRGQAGTGWLGAVMGEREVLVREWEVRETGDSLSFEEYDPVEVAIVREMLENGDRFETPDDEDDGSAKDANLPRQAPGSWPLAEAGPSGT